MKKTTKHIHLLIAIGLCCSVLFIQCNDDDNEEPETEHTGNYFPLEVGAVWDYDGEIDLVSKATGSPNESVNADVEGTRKVLEIQTLSISSGNHQVYPVKDHYYSNDNNYDLDVTQTRYFEKLNGSTYLRAYRDENGDLVEVSNPVYLKEKMVIGDEWETDPIIDLSNISGLEGLIISEMSINSKIIVADIEDIEIMGTNTESVRLEQDVIATLDGTLTLYGITYDIAYNIEQNLIMNLVEDIGLVNYEINYNEFEITIFVEGVEVKSGFTGFEQYELQDYQLSDISDITNKITNNTKSTTSYTNSNNPDLSATVIELTKKINRIISSSCKIN
jgi:hypothetical protein